MTKKKKTFGTFQGVFTPTALTILGVIMYLRHSWVVGNAGVIGALIIIFISVSITLFTSLSMSSMTTNIRIGSGGPFSIISQSLGLEIGGAIGIPLYLSQACVVAMYVFGFREGWRWIFPEHPAILVDFLTFSVIAVIGLISTDFAYKIQYVIMAIIFGSIISIVAGLIRVPLTTTEIQWLGDYRSIAPASAGERGFAFFTPDFWKVFAVFFPAVTGVTAGANMSGELTNPRTSIPYGTITAVVLTSFIYVGLTFVAPFLASTDELTSNYTVFIDKAYWKPIVLAGLLGATFSSGLSSFVGAPRILLAMGEKNILPKSSFFGRLSRRGEPINAMIFSSIVVVLSLLFRNLNAIAPLITMFFLLTYAMINLVVLIEQSLGLPSFRPTLKIPLIIPVLGAIGCFFVMFILNPIISLLSIIIVIAFYSFLVRKELTSKKSDARSGLFTAIAQWATKQSSELSPKREARAWQPEILLPVEAPKEIRGIYRLIYSLARPKGSIKILGMESGGQRERLRQSLPELVQTFNKASLSASYAFVEGLDFGNTVSISMQALESAFFKPNLVFLSLDRENGNLQEKYAPILQANKMHDWGLLLFAPFDQVGLGIEKSVNIWLDTIPTDWEDTLDLGGNDLALLTGLIIRNNWNAKLTLIRTVRPEETMDFDQVYQQVARIKVLARIPQAAEVLVVERKPDMWSKAPLADLNILELPRKEDLRLSRLHEIPGRLRASCLFTKNSGVENALV